MSRDRRELGPADWNYTLFEHQRHHHLHHVVPAVVLAVTTTIPTAHWIACSCRNRTLTSNANPGSSPSSTSSVPKVYPPNHLHSFPTSLVPIASMLMDTRWQERWSSVRSCIAERQAAFASIRNDSHWNRGYRHIQDTHQLDPRHHLRRIPVDGIG